jgi:hypothetical protein
MARDPRRLKDIGEQFAKGNMDFVKPYLADDIRWNDGSQAGGGERISWAANA